MSLDSIAIPAYTLADFESRLQADPDSEAYLELIDGVVYHKPMPTQEHGVIAARIIARTQVHIDDHQTPAYVGTEIRSKTPFDPHNSRMPDVSVQLSDGPTVKKGAVLGMPDLAVEILSPDDDPDEVRQKAHYYLHNGSQIAWLIFPDSKTVEVYTLDEEGQIVIQSFGLDDTLTGGTVLPDFRLAVASIFPK